MALEHAVAGELVRLADIRDSTVQTRALIKTDNFEAIHLVVRSGDKLPLHKVSGSMTLHCLSGQVTFTGGKSPDMRAGDWVYLAPGTPHALEAVEDSAFLLTILFDETGFGPRA